MRFKPLRIGISARLDPAVSGGCGQALAGLAHGLGRLQDGDEEYVFLVDRRHPDWLNPNLHANARVEIFRNKGAGLLRGPSSTTKRFRRAARRLDGMLRTSLGLLPRVAHSDGFLESLGLDVFYVSDGNVLLSRVPTVYNLQDLQFIHYPEFYTPQEYRRRNVFYRAGAQHASAVAVGSAWVRDDVVRQLGVDPERVWTIPWASPLSLLAPAAEPDMKNALERMNVPGAFAFYPAQMYRHKNHIRLIGALAQARDRHGVQITMVCSGARNEYWQQVEKVSRDRGLQEQVLFPGYVSDQDIRALYRFCRFLFFPSMFEGGGLPVLEAFAEGAAVACSSVTSLPEYAGDAALLFDPQSTDAMAEALARMWTDQGLRENLRKRGMERARLFSWERTARAYRAVFRQTAGRGSPEDARTLKECAF